MKKLIAITLVVIFTLFSMAYADYDYSSMTMDELEKNYDAIRNELFKRGLVADGKTVLFDKDKVSVYLTGKYEIRENSYSGDIILELEAVVINDTDTVITVACDSGKISVNGWDVLASGISETNSGKKQKGTFDIYISDADMTSYEEIEEIEFNLYIFDMKEFKNITDVESTTVYFNK